MEWNQIIFTHYGFIKNLQQVHPRDGHVEFTGKKKSAIPCEQNYTAWLVKKGISLSVSGEQVSRQASAQPAVFRYQKFRYFSAFWVVILVKYTVLFILGKCLMNSEQVILIFTEVWHYKFDVSW